MFHLFANTLFTIKHSLLGVICTLIVNFHEIIVFYDFGQDFHMLVTNPRKQKLNIQVKDSLGFTDLTVGTGEVSYLIPKNSFFFVKVQSCLSCFLRMALLVEWLIA
jgi:hypothetical protein